MTDRLPPNSAESEQGLLGCIMLDPSESLPKCEAAIEPGAFYDGRHRMIYEEACAMAGAGIPVNVFSLRQRLSDIGKLEQVGGVTYLSSLQDATPAASNASYFLEVLTEKWQLRQVLTACSAAAQACQDSTADLGSILDGVDKGLAQIVSQRGRSGEMRSMRELVNLVVDSWQAQKEGVKVGLMTGYPELDRLTQGLKPGEMMVLAARPSMGKTALGVNITINIASDGFPVGVFSMEMSDVSLVRRIMAGRASVNSKTVTVWTPSDFVKVTNAVGWATKLKVYIDGTPGLRVNQIRAKARTMKRKHDVKLIVIDYLQLIASDTNRGENREREVAQASNAIKNLARELEIPVILLCQLNREIEKDKNRKPRLSDLRESGSIEQDADIIGMLYKPASERPPGRPCDPTEINLYVAKNRDGERGDVEMMFFPEFTRFESISRIEEHA